LQIDHDVIKLQEYQLWRQFSDVTKLRQQITSSKWRHNFPIF